MTQIEDDEQILQRLGLTERQSKIYLAVAKIGKATITSICSTVKMDRGNVYRTIFKLLELGLVEKIITTPMSFEALPLSETITMLLENKEKEQADIEKEAKKVLEKHKRDNVSTFNGTDYEFALIPNGKLTEKRATELLDQNQKTHEILMYWRDFKDILERSTLKSLLHKEIQFRIIIFLQPKDVIPKALEDFIAQCPNCHIRKATEPPQASIAIVDEEKAMVNLTPTISKAPRLWIRSRTLVGFIEQYFENIWSTSSPIL